MTCPTIILSTLLTPLAEAGQRTIFNSKMYVHPIVAITNNFKIVPSVYPYHTTLQDETVYAGFDENGHAMGGKGTAMVSLLYSKDQ